MYKKNIKIIIFTVAVILGIIISMQFRSILQAKKVEQESNPDINEYMTQLENEKKKGEELADKIKKYEEEKDKYLEAFASISDDATLKNELDEVKKIAGLTDVKGPGVIIKMSDAEHDEDNSSSPQIIHDMDIVSVLNELRAAGAQAISINGERIMATSEQVCTGPTVRINNNRYAVPYEISAIGSPDKLQNQLERSSTVQLLRQFGIKIEISKSKEVYIPMYKNEVKYLTTGLEVDENE